MLSHARALLTSSPEGATEYVDADLRATGTIVERAAGVLDFGQPVAVMLLGILQGIPDQDEPDGTQMIMETTGQSYRSADLAPWLRPAIITQRDWRSRARASR